MSFYKIIGFTKRIYSFYKIIGFIKQIYDFPSPYRKTTFIFSSPDFTPFKFLSAISWFPSKLMISKAKSYLLGTAGRDPGKPNGPQQVTAFKKLYKNLLEIPKGIPSYGKIQEANDYQCFLFIQIVI